MSSKLACKECGSRETQCVDKGELEKVTGSTVGTRGFIDSSVLTAIIGLITGIFAWLTIKEANKSPYIVCKACGHYEKL